MIGRRSVWLAVSVAAIVAFFAALQIAAPPDGLFSGDQGAKYLQTRAFALQGPLRPGIEVASRDVDTELHHQILENRGGQLVGVFSWLLPLLSAPFFVALGDRGLNAIPALSAIAIFLMAAALGRRLTGGDGLWTAWAVLLTAPVLFYGAEIWEHAPAAACVFAAALLLLPTANWQPRTADNLAAFAAGAVIGVAVLFREEAGLALPALVLARGFVMPRGRRIADAVRTGAIAVAGAMAIVLPSIPMNMVVYRSPVPLHLSVETGKLTAHPRDPWTVIPLLLLPGRSRPIYVICAALGAAAALAWRRRGGDWWLALTSAAAIGLLAIAVVIPLWRLAAFRAQTPEAYNLHSLAHTWPFCIALVLLPLIEVDAGRSRLVRYVFIAAVLMTAGALAIIPGSGGAEWSPRYLLAAAPLLAVLASLPAQRTTAPRSPRGELVLWTARLVLIGSIAMQIDGIRYLVGAKARNARILHRVAELTSPGDVVISEVGWFPQVTAELIPSRRILSAWSSEDVATLAGLAAHRGIRTVVVVGSSGETGYRPPRELTSSAGCTFTRYERKDIFERGLILHRYGCAPEAPMVK